MQEHVSMRRKSYKNKISVYTLNYMMTLFVSERRNRRWIYQLGTSAVRPVTGANSFGVGGTKSHDTVDSLLRIEPFRM